MELKLLQQQPHPTGDGSSTLTTKGYVDGLITGATIYRGTWDPDITANSGNGTPDLSTVTQTSGYYYICSDIGTAHPNGTTGSPAVPCEPNSWAVGDWVIWNDDVPDCPGTGTGAWQKIDNTSVLSGVGTGQTVALWEGASSVTDSETLGNAPITVSSGDTTITGNLGVGAVNASYNLYNNGTSYFNGTTIVDAAFTQSGGLASTFSGDITGADNFKATGGNMKLWAGGTHVVNIDVNRNIYPNTHNSTDLGFSSALAFRELFLSGNITSGAGATFASRVTAVGFTSTSTNVYTGGMSSFETTLTNNEDWQNSPISILERGNVGSTQSADKYAPNLNFHWSAVSSKSLWVGYNGQLNFGEYSAVGIPASDGRINAATFNGDHLGTINTATTGTTQSAGNNSTLIATTAYADAAAGAVPIGNYLPLSAGSSYPLTGDLYQTMGTIGVAQTDQDYIAKIYELNSDGFLSLYTGQPTPLEKVRISSYGNSWIDPANNGNVGIGTTGPASKLHIAASGNLAIPSLASSLGTATSIALGNVGSTVVLAAGVSNTNVSWLQGRQDTGTGSAFDIAINPLGGNVGIGTTVVNSKLNVGDYMSANKLTIGGWYGGGGGTLAFRTGYVPNAAYVWDSAKIVATDDGNFNGRLEFQTTTSGGNGLGGAPSTKMVVKADGKVGIGTTNPTNKLHVYSGNLDVSGSNAGTGNKILLTTDQNAHYIQANGYWVDVIGNQAEVFRVFGGTGGTSEYLRVTGSGNVGIGTTTPLAKLDIQGTQGQLFSVTDDLSGSIFAVSDISGVPIFDVNSSGVSYFDGNVGIGDATPSYKLDLKKTDAAGNYAYFGASSDGGQRGLVLSSADNGAFLGAIHDFDATSGSGILTFSTGTTERMRISSAGAIKFNTYTMTQQTGTSAYLLGVDASGNVVQSTNIPSGTGGSAGPYLPLAGGTMTGTGNISTR